MTKTVEDRLGEWAAQGPTCRVSLAEWQFIEAMRSFARAGVGYGWMQQVIEWEWQHAADKKGLPGSAWGPEYYEGRIRDLEAALAKAEGGT
jgi:hypothetical protein